MPEPSGHKSNLNAAQIVSLAQVDGVSAEMLEKATSTPADITSRDVEDAVDATLRYCDDMAKREHKTFIELGSPSCDLALDLAVMSQ